MSKLHDKQGKTQYNFKFKMQINKSSAIFKTDILGSRLNPWHISFHKHLNDFHFVLKFIILTQSQKLSRINLVLEQTERHVNLFYCNNNNTFIHPIKCHRCQKTTTATLICCLVKKKHFQALFIVSIWLIPKYPIWLPHFGCIHWDKQCIIPPQTKKFLPLNPR